MTKQNVMPAEAVAATSMFPYPTPRAGSRVKYLSQIELGDCVIKSWMESMKASSPTHAKAAVALAPPEETDVDDEQSEWVMRHPSALSMFEQIVRDSKGKRIVMFLDYDGTLSPIVDDPDSAFMSTAVSSLSFFFSSSHVSSLCKDSSDIDSVFFLGYQMREAVKNVAMYFPTAIVSGRRLDKVINFVKLSGLYYAGSHGMDIKGPAKASHTKSRIYRALLERTKSTAGARVENNKFCVSVHFRCVDEKGWSALFEQVRSVLKDYPKLRLTQGRKVLEIRPTIKWDKGKALEFLLESLGYADRKNVLKDRGQGFGILVSKFPKETDATYSLQEPSEASVKDFLVRLVEWKRTSMKARFCN
ncbi:hypothetical protein ZIOFF_067222 [Zingiber officinale]|uniref:Trehalose-phosphatase n=1 Tax=Zingiber officinale TaxID=94328 RepID=A0A8J5BJH9_ZINOF|nr:hypothetical protein ZIOFF_067222 [Zingiber officinale]